MKNCLSVDWLTLHVKIPRKEFSNVNLRSTELFEKDRSKYKIEKEPMQTRHFRSIYKIYRNGEEMATMACEPHSHILSEDSGLLKIHNKYLYQENFYDYVVSFMELLDVQFRSISRIDLALDFLKFKNNLNPENFIKKFNSGLYLKRNKSQFNTRGRCGGARELRYETLKFGSETSDITYYLYNKTKELDDKKMKPWIVDNWRANGWDEKADVWRLEFSLKSNTDAIIDSDTGEQIFMFKELESLNKLGAIYNHFFFKYFTFVHNDKKKRVDRCRPLTLFAGFIETSFVKIKLSIHKQADRSSKIFSKALMMLNHELRGMDIELGVLTNELMSYFILDRGLAGWAADKLGFVASANQEYLHNKRLVTSLLSERGKQDLTEQNEYRSHNPVTMVEQMKRRFKL